MKKLFKQSKVNKAKDIKSTDDITTNMKLSRLGRVALVVAVTCASTYLSACAFREFLNQAKPQNIEIAEIQVHNKVNRLVSKQVELSVVKLEPPGLGVEKVKSEYEIRKENLCKINNITAEEYDRSIDSGEGVGSPNNVLVGKTDPFQEYTNKFFKKYPVTKVDLSGAMKQNNQVIGWVKMPALNISEPVIIEDAKDRNYYLTHDLNKQPSISGCIEADSKNIGNTVGCISNTILYGHNMLDGSKFGSLRTLLNESTQNKLGSNLIEYMNSDNNGVLFKVVSVFIIDENDFFYNSANPTFYSYKFWVNFKNNIKRNNIVPSFNEEGTCDSDAYLSLSTCYGLKPGARLVVVARQISTITAGE